MKNNYSKKCSAIIVGGAILIFELTTLSGPFCPECDKKIGPHVPEDPVVCIRISPGSLSVATSGTQTLTIQVADDVSVSDGLETITIS